MTKHSLHPTTYNLQPTFRLMYVVFSLDTGGLEKLVVELTRRIDRRRFIPSVCCLTKPGDYSAALLSQGVAVHYCQKRAGVDYGLFFRLARLLRREKTDIAHTQDNSTVLYGTVAARLAGVSTVINTEHGGVYFESKRKRLINKALWRLNNRVTCVSTAVKEDLQQMGLRNGKAVVIPNGIDSAPFEAQVDVAAIRQELGFEEHDFVISTVGRLSQEKNQQMLIWAARRILAEIPQAKFLIVGDGPLRESLQLEAYSLQLQDKILFLGNRTDVPRILKASNCFVSCSTHESFGLAIVEAMLAGLPVVATNVGGVSDLIQDRQIGLLVPKNDTGALVTAVVRLRKDSSFAQRMVTQAQKYAHEKYSVEKMVKSYESLYLDCLQ